MHDNPMDIQMNNEIRPCQGALERQISIAESLQKTLSVLNSNKELDEVLDFIVYQAKDILNADAVAIYTPQDKSGNLTIEASKGLSLDYIQKAIIPIGMGVTGLALSSRNPVAIEDIPHIEQNKKIILDKQLKGLVADLGSKFQSLLVVPLILTSDNSYGTLGLYYRNQQKFSEEEINLAKAYANQTILAIENTKLRASAKRSAALAERTRLARELHDTVNQTLFSMSLITGVLPDLWQSNQEVGAQALEEVNQLAKGAMMEMRSLLFELRPSTLFSLELEKLIQQLVDAFSSHNRVKVNYSYQPIVCNIPSDVKFTFYRVVQETFRNIEKHGHASHVNIILSISKQMNRKKRITVNCNNSEDQISVLIEDDGVGFYPGNLTGEHYGLRIMHERAREIGATLNIESEPGTGTRVSLIW